MQETNDTTFAENRVGCSSTRKRTVARSIGRVSTSCGEGGGQLVCRRARGGLNSCGREPQAGENGGVSEGKSDILQQYFSSFKSQ